MVKLSIIIPTLNEEKYLPKLLDSIKSQTFKDYEIIVSDGNSKDKTRQIAKKFGCKVVKGVGLPAVGRNKGAKAARGELLLFLDADVILPEKFLESTLKEFEKRKADVAFCVPVPIGGKLRDVIMLAVYDVFVTIAQYIKPFGSGFCILAKKEFHKKLRGFNEKIPYLEDIDYIQRTAKIGKYRVLNSWVLLSMRRFEKEGRWHTFARYLRTYIRRIRGKEVKGELAKDKNFYYRYDYKK